MLIGYLRPYQDDLHCHHQLEQLQQYPCDQYVTEEHASAKKRIALEQVIQALQPEDTLVVTKIFALADSTRHLAELLDQITKQQAYLVSIQEEIDTHTVEGKAFTTMSMRYYIFKVILSVNIRREECMKPKNGE